MGGGRRGLFAFDGLDKVGAEVLLGAGQVLVGGEEGFGCLIERAQIVGDGGAGLFEEGFEGVQVAGRGVEDGELAEGSDARRLEGKGAFEFGFGGGGVVIQDKEDGAQAGVRVGRVGSGGDGGAPEGEGFGSGGLREEAYFEGGSAGGVEFGDAVGELGGFGFIATEEARGFVVEAGEVFEGIDRVGVELDGELGFFAEAAGE